MKKQKAKGIKNKKRELGASLVEYGLLVAMIAVVSIVAVRGLSNQLETAFADAKDGFVAAGTGNGTGPITCTGPFC